jgi:hypothetical protein
MATKLARLPWWQTRDWVCDRVVSVYHAAWWRIRVGSPLARWLWLAGWRQMGAKGYFWGHDSAWCTPWSQSLYGVPRAAFLERYEIVRGSILLRHGADPL